MNRTELIRLDSTQRVSTRGSKAHSVSIYTYIHAPPVLNVPASIEPPLPHADLGHTLETQRQIRCALLLYTDSPPAELIV